jgi:hypothetical protein
LDSEDNSWKQHCWKEREVEMDQLRAEESQMKQIENYDDWAKK